MPEDKIRLQLIGTGDAFSSGGRNQTSFHVTYNGYQFLIDCGATSLTALKHAKISSREIDAIIITHFHGDHYGGLPFFFIDLGYNQSRTKDLTIVGPTGVKDRVLTALEIFYPGTNLADFNYQTHFMEYKEGEVLALADLSIEAFQVIHAPESNPHGFKITLNGKILAFSGDTGWTDQIFPIADNADLFICECNFYDTEFPFHLNYHQIMKHLKGFNCKRIILNHLGKEMLERIEDLELECAYDGQIIYID